ncbi:conserved hypothetical protein [Luminiphilus syltensis NOR5-1B]|uniref:Neurotransmitter-gated ion-channel ligand-binding domain-containing protein n=1 Tax=Luminiphilus syltensis NOR5-1B TaxID=565045 RepID=B8KRE1_9GAMM|nr:conserved hypothetical protein [Luminiphilus syltensis NOR5-1B]
MQPPEDDALQRLKIPSNLAATLLRVPGATSVLGPLLLLSLVFAAMPTQASPDERCSLESYNASTRPDHLGAPTTVQVGIMIVDMVSISDVDQTLAVDALLATEWRDKRLESLAGCRFSNEEVWTPELALVNTNSLEKVNKRKLLVAEGGTVSSLTRFSGDVLIPWHMADFPFDTAEWKLRLAGFDYGIKEIELEIADAWTGRGPKLTIPDWTIGEPSAQITIVDVPRLGRSVPVYELTIPGGRVPDYYIFKFIIPLCLIVMMSWAVFWVDPKDLAPQLGLAATTILTLVTFQFSVNAMLPRLGYFTAMDRYVFASSVLVFLALIEALISGELASNGREKLARRLDKASRYIFPTCYVITSALTLA